MCVIFYTGGEKYGLFSKSTCVPYFISIRSIQGVITSKEEKKMVNTCPVCNGKMKITELKCDKCGLEIRKEFEPSVFDRLDKNQYEFLITFLACEGNITDMQNKLDLNYPAVKRKIYELLNTLGINRPTEAQSDSWTVNNNSTKASDIVKSFFAKENGIAKIETQTGKVFTVDADDKTIGSFDGLRDTRYEYRVFDLVTDLLVSKGGEAKKGNGRNYKVGEKGCALDTIAGMIGNKYHNRPVGEYTFDPVFLIVAIMDRVGIVHNMRGYVRLTDEYKRKIGLSR